MSAMIGYTCPKCNKSLLDRIVSAKKKKYKGYDYYKLECSSCNTPLLSQLVVEKEDLMNAYMELLGRVYKVSIGNDFKELQEILASFYKSTDEGERCVGKVEDISVHLYCIFTYAVASAFVTLDLNKEKYDSQLLLNIAEKVALEMLNRTVTVSDRNILVGMISVVLSHPLGFGVALNYNEIKSDCTDEGFIMFKD